MLPVLECSVDVRYTPDAAKRLATPIGFCTRGLSFVSTQPKHHVRTAAVIRRCAGTALPSLPSPPCRPPPVPNQPQNPTTEKYLQL